MVGASFKVGGRLTRRYKDFWSKLRPVAASEITVRVLGRSPARGSPQIVSAIVQLLCEGVIYFQGSGHDSMAFDTDCCLGQRLHLSRWATTVSSGSSFGISAKRFSWEWMSAYPMVSV